MVNAILKKALVFFIPIILIACESKSTGETRDVKREPKTIDLPQFQMVGRLILSQN